MKKGKTIPLGYRDTDLEQKILLNTYKNKGIKEGLEKGEARGIAKKSLETAKYLLDKGFKEDIILGASGISIKELNKLRTNNINLKM